MQEFWVWSISIASIFGILTRPAKLPEWFWAISGSVVLILFQFISVKDSFQAILRGLDVYFFLLGMMMLSAQARHEGLFDWLAQWSTHLARGSSTRLFTLIYLAGILVTVFLSNDATAVVLTPAVYAATKKAGAKPTPYLFSCAFIANAASFMLPISNPANLVVFHHGMPTLLNWLKLFGLSSLASIIVTFIVLRIWFRESLRSSLPYYAGIKIEALNPYGKLTAFGLIFAVAVLIYASAMSWDLGLPTFLLAHFILLGLTFAKRRFPKEILNHISWGVILLVAGLFIIVEATNQAGALKWAQTFFIQLSESSSLKGKLVAAFSVGGISNLLNNLPVGLLSGIAVQHPNISEAIRTSVLVGVDVGPNLSVTGSLATILWLIVLRKENEHTSPWEFFRIGMVAMPVSVFLAVLFL